ncbi:hypothetical protein [Cereibacter azotoformans]|uniref:hypothetical protein n=1 Tax=Cereibacter azotoformans TaxID=43057 RepID=UPI000C6C95FC|nr:hypothetical protein [Cereibacter azotoformans]
MTTTSTTFRNLIAGVRAAQVPHFADPDDCAALTALEDRLEATWDAAFQILSQPARTVAELQLKADAFAWTIGGEPTEGGLALEDFQAAGLRALLADLAVMQA